MGSPAGRPTWAKMGTGSSLTIDTKSADLNRSNDGTLKDDCTIDSEPSTPAQELRAAAATLTRRCLSSNINADADQRCQAAVALMSETERIRLEQAVEALQRATAQYTNGDVGNLPVSHEADTANVLGSRPKAMACHTLKRLVAGGTQHEML